jgi:hypothetical protein
MHPRNSNTGILDRTRTKPAVGGFVGVFEDAFAAGYAAGMRHASEGLRSDVQSIARRGAQKRAKAKRVGKKDPKMARALRKANSMGRKKSGGFKKGWSQGKIMKKAHQIRRRMR